MSLEFALPKTAQNNFIPSIFRPGLMTNSYKLFWFLGLLDTVKDWEEMDIPLQEVLIRMVQRAWYPVLFFRLNFGKLDKLEAAILLAQAQSGLDREAPSQSIVDMLRAMDPRSPAGLALQDLLRWVPYRLLVPWFEQELKGIEDSQKNKQIEALAADRIYDLERAPLYYFIDKRTIRLTWDWREYLRDHYAILHDYTLWQLTDFLQRRNPNTANIAAKLLPMLAQRDHAKLRPTYQAFLQHHQDQRCLYSGLPLVRFDLDHFVPWSFVTHDLPWNILPAHPSANNQKRDQLPDTSLLPGFADFQWRFLNFIADSHDRNKKVVIDAYEYLLQAEARHILAWPAPHFIAALTDHISPLLIQARHQGFPGPWVFGGKG